MIAEYLRLRQHRLRTAALYSDETLALRTVVRSRGDLVEMRVAAINQLPALLEAHWPGAKAIFADVGSPDQPGVPDPLAATPAAAAHLGEKRMAAFLVKHGYCGRRPAAELLARLRAAPAGTSRESLTEALRDAVLAAVGVLAALNGGGQEPRPLGGPPTSESTRTARSSRRCQGRVRSTPPRCCAERGDCRQAYDGPDSVAALAGCTPVTSQSGKHRAVHFRWACNKRFRVAVTTFADNSRHASPWAAKIYNDARASGKDHPHAVRILARALGSASSGPAGSRASATTPPGTAPLPHSPGRPHSQSRHEVDTGGSYLIVVRGSACEAASCTSRSGTPASRAAVMKACRSV